MGDLHLPATQWATASDHEAKTSGGASKHGGVLDQHWCVAAGTVCVSCNLFSKWLHVYCANVKWGPAYLRQLPTSADYVCCSMGTTVHPSNDSSRVAVLQSSAASMETGSETST